MQVSYAEKGISCRFPFYFVFASFLHNIMDRTTSTYIILKDFTRHPRKITTIKVSRAHAFVLLNSLYHYIELASHENRHSYTKLKNVMPWIQS